ncbi:MAG: substrate-binding domain-containing protein [Chloroflexota bacterium]
MKKLFGLLFLLLMVACGQPESQTLRLATTTSTHDSGLLDAILPTFEAENSVSVEVIAVGTGQAIALGEAGDVDVILVHARSREDAFIAAGHGTERFDVMYNDFIIVGPPDDPAQIKGMTTAAEALKAIDAAKANFASRGDDSGTHTKERMLWEAVGMMPEPSSDDWYHSVGQGMGSTLTFANENGDYTLTDRGTFLSSQDNLPNLVVMVGGSSIAENVDASLLNPYGVIPINPDKADSIQHELAMTFAAWLTQGETQEAISVFGLEMFGQPLFYPDSAVWDGG